MKAAPRRALCIAISVDAVVERRRALGLNVCWARTRASSGGWERWMPRAARFSAVAGFPSIWSEEEQSWRFA